MGAQMVFKNNEAKSSKAYYNLLNIRIMVSCLFLLAGLTLYLLNYINFPALCLLLAGAIWNFFVNINSFLAFMLSFVVGILYALFAVIDGLYINALLYTAFYIPLQFVVWIQNIGATDMVVNENKKLKGRSIYFIVLAVVLCFVCGFAISISSQYTILPVLDTVVACGLGLSAYLQSFKYREYYFVRFIAVALAVVLWVSVIGINGLSIGSITMILLYLMYFVLDVIAYFFWLQNVEDYNKSLFEDVTPKGEKTLVQDKVEEYNKMLKESQVKDFKDNDSLKA